ncbi:MAG TPA: hypothetical protein DC049_14480, partial [Spirochaetia bacterium]|nr:hypothetical protein [Spirochaetia bacterium]
MQIKKYYYVFHIAVIFSSYAVAAWYSNWTYREEIIFDYAIDNDLTNFPVLLYIANHDNFKNLSDTNGSNIVFTLVDGSTKLDHEIEYFDQASGQLWAWIRMPVLDSTEINSNIIYMYYDKIYTDKQQKSSSVWDTAYRAVWHMNNDPASSGGNEIKDSTVNSNHCNTYGSMSSADIVGGKGGNAISFDGTDDYMQVSTETNLDIDNTITISFWVKPVIDGNFHFIFNKGGWNKLIIRQENVNKFMIKLYFTNNISGGTRTDSGEWEPYTFLNDEWQNITYTWDKNSSLNNLRLYIDGTLKAVTTAGVNSNLCPSTNNAAISSSGAPFNGTLDEIWISETIRSSNWIATAYKNQNDPVSFRTIGMQTEYGLPTITITTVNIPQAVVGHNTVFNVRTETMPGNISNIFINFGDNTFDNLAASSSVVNQNFSHIYCSNAAFLFQIKAFSDIGKIRTNSMYITPSPYAMPQAGGAELVYLNEGLKIKWTLASTNHISRAVIYRNSLQLASISPVSTDMEYLDRYLLYDTAYTYQIGT